MFNGYPSQNALMEDENNAAANNSVDQNDLVKKTFTHVRVLHNFRGSNNDELCMKKDDIITLTQTPSGGWWEGTLSGVTGWFPANYVTPILHSDPLYHSLVQTMYQQDSVVADNHLIATGPYYDTANTGDKNVDNLAEYRSIVIKDIEDSERIFIENLQNAINFYLKPLYQVKIFPSDTEINAVLRSITEVCSVHRRFLSSLDKIKSVGSKENRIGGLFMQYAPQFKHAHFEYCSNHARFVNLVENFKKDICAFFTAHPPSTTFTPVAASPSHTPINSASTMPNVIITSSLSASFRRLDKYPALLQELQRYTEENHVDRGDTQRAGFLFREIAMYCLELRRRKEMELEVMLGNIRNFDGLKIETYGNILKMEPASVLILPHWSEPKKDCYVVLFSKVLMILSVGNEMTSFTYESMIQLEQSRLQVLQNGGVTSGEDGGEVTFRLEINGHSAHPLSDSDVTLTYVVYFSSEEVCKELYQMLQKQIRHTSSHHMEQDRSSGGTGVCMLPLSHQSSSLSTTSSSITSPQSGSASSTSSLFSPLSTTTSNSELLPLGKPPLLQSRVGRQMGTAQIGSGGIEISSTSPALPPLPQHRTKAVNGANTTESFPKRVSFWSDQILTCHPPYRPWFPNMAEAQNLNSKANGNANEQTNRNSLDPNEDMQLLNLIDVYHRKVPGKENNNKGRKLSNPNLDQLESNELEPHQLVEIIENGAQIFDPSRKQLSAAHINNGGHRSSLATLAAKINSISSNEKEILVDIFEQLRAIRFDMDGLAQKLSDERRQRKRLQEIVIKNNVSSCI